MQRRRPPRPSIRCRWRTFFPSGHSPQSGYTRVCSSVYSLGVVWKGRAGPYKPRYSHVPDDRVMSKDSVGRKRYEGAVSAALCVTRVANEQRTFHLCRKCSPSCARARSNNAVSRLRPIRRSDCAAAYMPRCALSRRTVWTNLDNVVIASSDVPLKKGMPAANTSSPEASVR